MPADALVPNGAWTSAGTDNEVSNILIKLLAVRMSIYWPEELPKMTDDNKRDNKIR